MDDEIEKIQAHPLIFKEDEKIFNTVDEEGNTVGEPFSHNDWLEKIKSISGVNEELMGK